MLAIKMLSAALVLGLAGYVLRRPPAGLLRGALAFIGAFGLTAAGIGMAAHKAGIVRDGPYAQIAANALREVKADPAPYVLFVGASYSRNAINDAALTRKLRAHGYPQRIITFALEGASLQERDLRLRQFLRAAPRPPDVVFLEASPEFDRAPVHGFVIAKFSERVIGQFDPRGTLWAVRGLAKGAPDGLAAYVKNAVLLGLHVPINWFNVGLFNEATTLRRAPALSSWDPQQTPRRTVTAKMRSQGLAQTKAPPEKLFAWGEDFRAAQRKMLENAGVRAIAYYFPPVISPDERAYLAAVCKAHPDTPCIAPDDPKMLAALDGPVWFDEEHLLAPGAAVYDRWLARKIMQSGVLGNPDAHPQLALREAP